MLPPTFRRGSGSLVREMYDVHTGTSEKNKTRETRKNKDMGRVRSEQGALGHDITNRGPDSDHVSNTISSCASKSCSVQLCLHLIIHRVPRDCAVPSLSPMDLSLIPDLGFLAIALLSAIILTAGGEWKRRLYSSFSFKPPHPPPSTNKQRPRRPGPDISRKDNCEPFKQLYYKLHNLERYPGTLPEARTLLLSLLSEALQVESDTRDTQGDSSILSLEQFSATSLESFVFSGLDGVTAKWQQYVARRRQGGPRELFRDAAEARRWLVQRAPLKFVDGAWLGHVHKITTPFAFRRVTKAAWQVLSEELGDGDLAKCHAHVYAELLKKVGIFTPAPNSEAFIQHAGMDDLGSWRSGVAQLLISLFPNEFLPEILGFNLNFEMMTMETLLATKELREVGIDPYYFSLHITIDNADSGHTAMASRTVAEYMHLVANRGGDAAAQQAWRRIQAGFALSKNVHQPSDGPGPNPGLNSKILDIFLAKSVASRGVHEHCPATITGKKLGTWLDPDLFRQREWQTDFLRCLSNTKPWVYRGDSGRSRLVQQLCWGGSMFGAFTDREVAVVRDWVESLATPGAEVYEEFTGRDTTEDSLPGVVATTSGLSTLSNSQVHGNIGKTATGPLRIDDASNLDVTRLLPLWFAHSCLLESAVAVPWNVASSTGCAIVRLLRAQYGFLPEPVGVDGLDEMTRDDHIDLVDIAMELISSVDPKCSAPEGIEEALRMWPSPFAENMLTASTRPQELRWVLLGLAQAFSELHSVLASFDGLLSEANCAALASIAKREQESLALCSGELRRGSSEELDFQKGYRLGIWEIQACFEHQ